MKKFAIATLLSVVGFQTTLNAAERKVGVLFSSYGDIDKPEEVEGYIKAALKDPDVAPIPWFLKGLVANLGWLLEGKNVTKEYLVIGGSKYRATARAQADLVQQELIASGLNAKTYTGFVFTYPFIRETMAQIQADGITDLVVINQGAQYSKVTQGINIREVKSYLAKHKEYTPNTVAVKSFSDDTRFRDLVAKSIQQEISENFADVPASDMCIYLPTHGLPMALPENGDPAVSQMLSAYEDMKARFSGNLVAIGFQNHDELGTQWTLPDSDVQAKWLADQADCPNILINGRISFTVDNIETMYDQNVQQRSVIEEARPGTKVVVAKSFNSDADFAKLMSTIAIEALNGKGDIATIK